MPTEWTIRQLLPDGTWSGPVTLKDFGVLDATRAVNNQAEDTLELRLPGGRAPAAAALAYEDTLRVLRDDFDGPQGASNPRGWFTGTVRSVRPDLSGSGEGSTLTLVNPWGQFLARCVYTQLGLYRLTQAEADAVAIGAAAIKATFGKVPVVVAPAPALQRSSTILLTQAQENGLSMGSQDTLRDILQYALDKGARFTIGTLPPDVSIPSEQIADSTCADLVKKVLRWMPGAITSWDYEADPPTLNFLMREGRQPLTLAVGGDAPQVQAVSLTPRPDLVLPGVALQFMRRVTIQQTVSTTTTTTPAATEQTPDPQPTSTTTYGTGPALTNPSNSSGYQSTATAGTATTGADGSTSTTSADSTSVEVITSEIDTAGLDPYWFGAMVASVQLQGGTIGGEGTINTAPFEPTPVGLAQAIYDSRKNLSFEGSVALKAQEVIPLGNPLVRALNLSGGDPAWEAMDAEVQQAQESIATGATSLQVGPPTHLGPGDLAALLKAARNRTSVDAGMNLLRNQGQAPQPPSNPLPPGAGTPPGSNGGSSGPSKAPDGGHETSQGFTGILRKYSGQATTHAPGEVCFKTDANGGSIPGSGTDHPQIGIFSAAAPEQETGPGAGGFYAMCKARAIANPGTLDKPTNGTAYWQNSNTATREHTEGTLDLTGFSAFSYSYLELRGTHTFTDSFGNTKTEDYSENVTGRAGLSTLYRLYAAGTPQKYLSADGTGSWRADGDDRISVDRLYAVPRTDGD